MKNLDFQWTAIFVVFKKDLNRRNVSWKSYFKEYIYNLSIFSHLRNSSSETKHILNRLEVSFWFKGFQLKKNKTKIQVKISFILWKYHFQKTLWQMKKSLKVNTQAPQVLHYPDYFLHIHD